MEDRRRGEGDTSWEGERREKREETECTRVWRKRERERGRERV